MPGGRGGKGGTPAGRIVQGPGALRPADAERVVASFSGKLRPGLCLVGPSLATFSGPGPAGDGRERPRPDSARLRDRALPRDSPDP